MILTRSTIGFIALCLADTASAQAPPQLGESARRVVGSWEFSNADRDRTCTATLKGEPGPAGLDVFAKEPHVPKELIEMDHIVLFPHLGSSTEVTRAAMDQLVVDNILAWSAGKPPLTPVPETPWPSKRS